MGSARTLLAISVVFAHSYGFLLVGGKISVQIFYLISGFLISYILVEANTYRTLYAFYKNRFLRIFPLYWLISLTTLIFFLFQALFLSISNQVFETYSDINWNGRLFLTLSNLLLFGQDWIMFTGVRDGNFQFVSNFGDSDIEVWRGLLAPQAWTLGIELSFYTLSPFLLRNRLVLLFSLSVAALLRAYMLWEGLYLVDPWSYRFFPAELGLFLLGASSHQIWKPWLERRGYITRASTIYVFIFIIFYILSYSFLPNQHLNSYLIIIIFAISFPFIFSFQSNYRWDRRVGELSYPIYISHMLVVWTIGSLMASYGVEHRSAISAGIIVLFTLFISLSLKIYFINYIEISRLKIKRSQ